MGRHDSDRMVVGLTTTYAISTPVSFTSKTDRHDTTDILLTVALNTVTLSQYTVQPQSLVTCVLI